MLNELKVDFNYEELVAEISNQRFYPVFQPIYSVGENKIVGYEVLARWYNGYSVEETVKQLEENEGISLFSSFFLSKLCRIIDGVNFKNSTFISVNLSPIQLSSPCFLLDFFPLIDKCNKLGITLWFELTEYGRYPSGDDLRVMKNNLYICNKLNVRFAIDDFGTGNNIDESCIDIVRPKVVKLDKTFLKRKVNQEWDDINELSYKYRFDLLAEGVESSLDWEFIKDKNVRFAQGYYLGLPGAYL